ncbi:sigma-70 family RNA polymerase sigma factor [Eubacterium callanderi]|uniref:Sigma-70 family RNA polymerase sigma factor n=1 Tax=Eubacterium callanderi TaxID=53442 RepID=A0A853JRP7_9FIRM|nr:sigma-70 family RNA polymerase sigma factor [Eubacterium callanderi]
MSTTGRSSRTRTRRPARCLSRGYGILPWTPESTSRPLCKGGWSTIFKRREGRFSTSLAGTLSLDRPVEGADGAVALAELILDEKADVEGACVAAEQQKALLRAYRKLSPGQREVLRYQYLEKGTLSELAAQKGVSPAAITQTHKRALAALKRHL